MSSDLKLGLQLGRSSKAGTDVVPKGRIQERIQAWRETPVTSLLVTAGDPGVMRTMAELVL